MIPNCLAFTTVCDAVDAISRHLETDDEKEGKSMHELRLAKYETLIEDINQRISKFSWSFAKNFVNVALALIFDYDSCNEYAKKIIEKSELYIISSSKKVHTDSWQPQYYTMISVLRDVKTDSWQVQYPNIASLGDAKTKINAAKLLVQYCRDPQNASERYKFIFWSLMILTVDKNNAEEHLSLICDFAKMLRITNEEFEDIIYTIKCVYNEADKEYTFKSETIPEVLGGILNLYSDQDKQ